MKPPIVILTVFWARIIIRIKLILTLRSFMSTQLVLYAALPMLAALNNVLVYIVANTEH